MTSGKILLAATTANFERRSGGVIATLLVIAMLTVMGIFAFDGVSLSNVTAALLTGGVVATFLWWTCRKIVH